MTDEDEIGATTRGLVQCLRMLAEEAESLNLTSTFAALRDALATCTLETGLEAQDSVLGRPMHAVLH